jgi:hypothetical protein
VKEAMIMTEDLSAVFRRLKKTLATYEGPLAARIDRDSRYELWSEKAVVIAGRKKKVVSLAGLIIQKNYVGLSDMPVYSNGDLKKFFSPGLLKLLKCKSCFHLRTLAPALERQIGEALERGFDMYRERGWV